jgi:hypothetical protein
MGGGLMQLVAYGAQDIYLTGNPQITFWKMIYRRHTNFSRDVIEQKLNGVNGSDEIGNKLTGIISRNGDLLHRMNLDITYASNTCRYPNAFASIDNVEIHIGGQLIDTHYGEWMHVWTNLTETSDKSILLNEMTKCQISGRTATVPIQFWFCRNPGLALPLIALQYHEVKFTVTFASASSASETISDVKLWCEYVYLDTDERRRFAQIPHEYLIEQVQRTHNGTINSGYGANTYKAKLSIFHPVKELIWFIQNSGLTDESTFNYRRYEGNISQAESEHEQITTAKLKLNGHDRSVSRNAEYYRIQQRYEHHCGTGMRLEGTHDADGEITFTAVDNNLTDDSALIYSASSLAAYTHGTVLLNDASGASVVDNTTLNVDLSRGCIVQFSSGTTQLLTLTEDYRYNDQRLVGTNGAVAIANTHSITNVQIPYINLNHVLSDFDADLLHIGDVLVVTPTATTYDSHISSDANASAQTITITADNYDRDTGRLKLNSTIFILANKFDNTNSASIAVTLRNNKRGSKIVSELAWVYCYSFSLEPEQHQPSGTCNFSRVDLAHLYMDLKSDETSNGSNIARVVKVYAINYNVLRIMSGMGGLAYDN